MQDRGDGRYTKPLPVGRDDLIDFACSDSYLGYYHEMGMTPRRPTREQINHFTVQAPRNVATWQEINSLQAEIVRLRAETRDLRGQVKGVTKALSRRAQPPERASKARGRQLIQMP